MNTAEPSQGDLSLPNPQKKRRMAFAYGIASLSAAGALAFYVFAAFELSRRSGGFARLETARPNGYPGIRWFIVICVSCAVFIAYCTLHFLRVLRAMRHERNG